MECNFRGYLESEYPEFFIDEGIKRRLGGLMAPLVAASAFGGEPQQTNFQKVPSYPPGSSAYYYPDDPGGSDDEYEDKNKEFEKEYVTNNKRSDFKVGDYGDDAHTLGQMTVPRSTKDDGSYDYKGRQLDKKTIDRNVTNMYSNTRDELCNYVIEKLKSSQVDLTKWQEDYVKSNADIFNQEMKGQNLPPVVWNHPIFNNSSWTTNTAKDISDIKDTSRYSNYLKRADQAAQQAPDSNVKSYSINYGSQSSPINLKDENPRNRYHMLSNIYQVLSHEALHGRDQYQDEKLQKELSYDVRYNLEMTTTIRDLIGMMSSASHAFAQQGIRVDFRDLNFKGFYSQSGESINLNAGFMMKAAKQHGIQGSNALDKAAKSITQLLTTPSGKSWYNRNILGR